MNSADAQSTRPDGEEHRAHLLRIAYRMLGSLSDAEDLVQEALLRYQLAAVTPESVRAYLTTILVRLCLNELVSARVRRDSYLGPWLPTPVRTDDPTSPLAQAERRESLSMAFLVLLEQLSPVERAVFLLREVFDEPYEEIAPIVGKSVQNCRQIFHRAQRAVASGRPRFQAAPEEHRRLFEQFIRAVERGDLAGLTRLLAASVTLWADGGGRVSAATRPVHGAEAVARFVLGVARQRAAGTELQVAELNGSPGLLLSQAGRVTITLTLDVADGQVAGVRFVLNPEKLRALQPPATRP